MLFFINNDHSFRYAQAQNNHEKGLSLCASIAVLNEVEERFAHFFQSV